MRWIVAAFHSAVAVAIATSGLWMLAQGRVNLAWEAGFYRMASPGSLAMLFGAFVGLGLAAIVVVSAIGYATERRWGAFAMFGTSATLFAMSLQTPLALAMGLTGVLALWELVGNAWRAAEADEDDEG